jgi:hypothetical protein
MCSKVFYYAKFAYNIKNLSTTDSDGGKESKNLDMGASLKYIHRPGCLLDLSGNLAWLLIILPCILIKRASTLLSLIAQFACGTKSPSLLLIITSRFCFLCPRERQRSMFLAWPLGIIESVPSKIRLG